ncbi:hypothetical protein [Microbacterium pumilum]|uniref:DUF4352 domain-containing protein n=1 Tax=Microbacterium pumilum TaxID=344165 RepID=A0ABN2T4K3_9MICO
MSANRLVAAVATLAVLGSLAFAGCSSPTTGSAPPDDTTAAEDTEETEAPAAAAGTRENPFPLGTVIESDEWTVVVNSVTLDGNEAVAAANQFNEPPAEGSQYIVVNYTVTYTGDDPDGQMGAFVTLDYVTASGTTVDSMGSLAVAPDPAVDTTSALYNGGSVTGNKAIAVPSPPDGVLAIQPGMLADKVFSAIQ